MAKWQGAFDCVPKVAGSNPTVCLPGNPSTLWETSLWLKGPGGFLHVSLCGNLIATAESAPAVHSYYAVVVYRLLSDGGVVGSLVITFWISGYGHL